MYDIFHLIDNLGVGGAQTMLFELYHAIGRYYPQHNQGIIYKQPTRFNESFVKSSDITPEKITEDRKIAGYLGKRNNVVVIYHKLASSNIKLVSYIKKRTKAKIIAINHTLFQSSSWNSFGNIDAMISVSEHMKKKLKLWHPLMEHVCIRNGFNQYKCDKIKERVIDKSAYFLTGRINRICAWKHSDKWLQWCYSVKLPKSMVHEYIGDKISGRLRSSVKQKGKNVVKMMGGITDFKKKISIIKSWDVFLYETNHNEGISMAILEALACGVPVICSNHYGNKEIIENGVNGYVFKDREHAREILRDLIKDPAKLKRLKKSTRKHFTEKLDAKHTATKYINLIDSMYGIEHQKPAIIVNLPDGPAHEEGIKLPKKKSNKKFTILSSTYNKAEYLRDWASSILQQKYRPLEVVLANDQSTDGTLKVVKEIEKNFSNNNIGFKFINNKERLYCGSSYCKAVRYATGSYVGVLDADDMLAGDAVGYIMNLYKSLCDAAWIYTQFLWCDETMRKKRRGFNSAPPKGQSLLSLGDRGIHGIGTGWRTFSHEIERPDKLFGEGLTCAVDKYMAYRLEEFGAGVFVDKICYHHRGHPIGSTKSVSSTKTAMGMWKKVIAQAHKRRKIYGYKPYPIVSFKCGK